MKTILLHSAFALLLPLAIASCVEPRGAGGDGTRATEDAEDAGAVAVAPAGEDDPTTSQGPQDPLEPGPDFDRSALDGVVGAVRVDGSSTVFPITEIVAVAAGELAPDIEVGLGVSGTGGGFQSFCRGEVDIANASRPIKAAEQKL
ncbi:MAG: substrate-binding domain-containing protein, partial [Acidobacteriota bacterium]